MIRRRIGALAALGAAAAALLVVAAPGANAATGTVHTDSGQALTIRATASTSAAAVDSLANGASFTIDCQTYGSSVSGKYGTSTVWDHVSGNGGYVSDTYVYTGSDGLVAPLCGGTSTACSTSGTGDPHTCMQAVNWAIAHKHTDDVASYYRACDHLVALAYGWSASGSTTAYVHWTQIPAKYKHAGSTSVPAGGLAFFSNGGSGHVMISIGGGRFISNDIHGNGSYTETTIAEIKSRWGQTYLGWAQPWFKINH